MARHRSHSIEFKRRVAQEFIAGETLHALAKRHDVSRTLIRVWVKRLETGALDEDAEAADLLQAYEAKIAALAHAATTVDSIGLNRAFIIVLQEQSRDGEVDICPNSYPFKHRMRQPLHRIMRRLRGDARSANAMVRLCYSPTNDGAGLGIEAAQVSTPESPPSSNNLRPEA